MEQIRFFIISLQHLFNRVNSNTVLRSFPAAWENRKCYYPNLAVIKHWGQQFMFRIPWRAQISLILDSSRAKEQCNSVEENSNRVEIIWFWRTHANTKATEGPSAGSVSPTFFRHHLDSYLANNYVDQVGWGFGLVEGVHAEGLELDVL